MTGGDFGRVGEREIAHRYQCSDLGFLLWSDEIAIGSDEDRGTLIGEIPPSVFTILLKS